MRREDYIIYGDAKQDDYFIVEHRGETMIVNKAWGVQESAVLFKLDYDGDWSEGMIMDAAKNVVDHLNKTEFYPDASS